MWLPSFVLPIIMRAAFISCSPRAVAAQLTPFHAFGRLFFRFTRARDTAETVTPKLSAISFSMLIASSHILYCVFFIFGRVGNRQKKVYTV